MDRKRHLHLRQLGGTDINGKADKIGTDVMNGTNECRFSEPPSHFLQNSLPVSRFFQLISRTDNSECRARRPHGTHRRRTFFSSRVTCLTSMAQDELNVAVRVIPNSHSIISCPIAISLICLTSLLAFLICWSRNLVETAPIHGAVLGFAV